MAADDWQGWGGYGHPFQEDSDATTELTEARMDDRYLETIPEVESIRSKRSTVSSIPSESQFRAMPQAVQRLSRPHLEPIWAQSTSSSSKWQQNDDERRGSYSDISPPSTPRKSWGGSIDETPVSPIEPIPPVPKLPAHAPIPDQQPKTQIPRKVPVPSARKEPTKWDAYSGERTTDGSGIVSSIRPGTVPIEQQYPQLKPRTKEILANLRLRSHERKPSKTAEPAAAQSTAPMLHREPWRGASGRSAIVEPVRDTPQARTNAIGTLQRTPESPVMDKVEKIEGQQLQHNFRAVQAMPSHEELRPVVPLKITKSRTPSPPHSAISPRYASVNYSSDDYYTESPSPSPPPTAETKLLQSPFHSPVPPKLFDEPVPLCSTRTDSPQQDPSPETPRTPSPEHYQSITSIPQTSSQSMEPEVSRFSWTTYATSVNESPRSAAHIGRSESPPPPIPIMPEIHKRAVPQSSAFNNHLYANADAARSQGSIILRKPLPVSLPSISIPSPSVNRGRKQPVELTTSKTLPQIPPELEAADKISGLEVQKDALARRKYNLDRIILNLKKDLEKNRVNYDMYKRREVEGKITSYEKEMQAVTNEQHEIGLLLHRAIKKRDREDGYELPTGLWIRRVTS